MRNEKHWFHWHETSFATSKWHILKDWQNSSQNLLHGLWKGYRRMDLFHPTAFFRPKTISKVAISWKQKVQPLLFFFSPPFLLLALSFSPVQARIGWRHPNFQQAPKPRDTIKGHFNTLWLSLVVEHVCLFVFFFLSVTFYLFNRYRIGHSR